ncbi:MAG: FtsQ-type POTRA domain-containing protein [Christensenellaceae bacterium]|nr:FtsQ-type POTRA domain-containing protein [Christensenellaceae bacterium]
MNRNNKDDFIEIDTKRIDENETDIFGETSSRFSRSEPLLMGEKSTENDPELMINTETPFFNEEDWIEIEENRRKRREARLKRKRNIETSENKTTADFFAAENNSRETTDPSYEDEILDESYDDDEELSEEEWEQEEERLRNLSEKIDRNVAARQRFYRILMLVVAAVTLVFLVFTFLRAEVITVEGNINYSPEYIVALAEVKPKQHLFTIDRSDIEENIMRDPFIRLASVRYSFPNKLKIRVNERIPVGAIKISAQYIIVDKECNALAVLDSAAMFDVPVVNGVGVTSIELGYQLRSDDAYKLSVMQHILYELSLNNLTERTNMVELSDINDIVLHMKSGMLIEYGQGDRINEKTAWAKAILDTLTEEGIKKGTVDVSTENSAIYREPQASQDEEPSATPIPEG